MTEQGKEMLDIINEAYKQGYKNAVDNACEYFDSVMYYVNTEELGQRLIVPFNTFDEFIEDFRKIIEQWIMTREEQRERQIEQAADQNPNLDEWFDQIYVWFMNNDRLRKKIGLSNQYELMLELHNFLNNKHHEK